MKKLLIISLLIVGCITEPEILCPEQKIYIECGADITTYIFEGEIIDEHNTFVIVNGNDTLFNYLDYNIQVYNTLNLFSQHGILRILRVPSDKFFFDTNLKPHHHFFCKKSEELIDIKNSEIKLTKVPKPPKGKSISSVQVFVNLD